MRTLVFLDLDNTFWTMDGVPHSALEAIEKAQRNGHLVFSNTGRGRAGTRDLEPYALDGRCYAAGAEAFLGKDKIVDEPLGIELSHQLLGLLDVGEGILIAEGGESCFVHAYDRPMFNDLLKDCAKTGDPFIDWPDIDEMTDADHAQIYKYSLWVQGGVSEAIKQSIPSHLRHTTMGDATEFTQRGNTKATVLNAVRQILQERMGEQLATMAFGDSGNDISMIQAADTGVAMGNGTDEAKAAADYVTLPILEDGLYHAFEHFGLM